MHVELDIIACLELLNKPLLIYCLKEVNSALPVHTALKEVQFTHNVLPELLAQLLEQLYLQTVRIALLESIVISLNKQLCRETVQLNFIVKQERKVNSVSLALQVRSVLQGALLLLIV